MDTCRLPVELCEAIMNALQRYYVHIGHPIEWLEPSTTWESQQALCACALTCRAWRIRAQHLLWTSPYLFNGQRLSRFNAVMRNPPNVAITTLMLGDHDSSPSQSLDLSAASELFMHLSSHPERLQCANILFDRGPPTQVLRIRLPFFANIAVLRLYRCTFQSLRAMLDVVWVCPNLATLVIYGSVSKSGHSSAAGIKNMATAVGHKQACGKLTALYLDASTIKQVWDPASLGPIGGGRLFGNAVTELVFSSNYAGLEGAELLSSLLNRCFPALRSITVISLGRPVLVEGIRELSWLHVIARALDQKRTGTLESIVIEGRHNVGNNGCCREAVGTSEVVVGSKRRLPELFIGLAELVIRSNRHATEPRKCAAYVRSVLPGMRDVLRFELEQASSMEDCYLTIGLCEEVMNMLPDHKLLEGDHASWPSYDRVPEWQQALRACALTCRAWRARAQHLLWTIPHLSDNRHFAQFTTAIRNTPNISIIITGLVLGPGENSYGALPLDLSTAGELFISSFPRLQRLLCNSIRFDRGPPLHMLRMRLPFFVGITTLRLLNCTFQSLRAMLDIVWACTNLATLDIHRANFNSKPYSSARLQQMLDAMNNLRAGRKLATLYLDSCTLEKAWDPATIAHGGGGLLFGYAVTELDFSNDCVPAEWLSNLLTYSFPGLRSVKVTSVSTRKFSEDGQGLSLLGTIATGRPIPGILKTVLIRRNHDSENNDCCKEVVGTSEKVFWKRLLVLQDPSVEMARFTENGLDRYQVPGKSKEVISEHLLPELLVGLAELTIGLDRCRDPGRCATYIWSVLPGMRDILRFEYRASPLYDWRPYMFQA